MGSNRVRLRMKRGTPPMTHIVGSMMQVVEAALTRGGATERQIEA